MRRDRWSIGLLAAGLLVGTSLPARADLPLPAPQIQVQIDGKAQTFGESPFLLDGRTLLPLRAIFERLGAQVVWNESTQSVTATKGDRQISLQIGSSVATVDGRPVTLDVPAMLVGDHTYVPVRFVSEALGGYVSWDALHQTVQISASDLAQVGRNRASIRDRWLAAQPRYTGKPLLAPAATGAPFQAGQLQPAVLDDGLRMLNFVRYLAYLPDDVALESGYTEMAQHAAVINAFYGELNHHPTQPAGMDQGFYQLALKGSSQSNLGAGFRTPAEAIQRGYMDDSDPSNIDRLGHRRWILSPRMGKVGFGWVPSPERYGAFDALYVFDGSRAPAADFTHWAWPSAGYFPTSFFGADQAWSVGINPDRVQVTAQTAVTLTRDSDGQTWRFGPSATKDGYFQVDTGGYGYTKAIIFRPDGLKEINPEESFTVTVTGLTDKGGAPFPLSYHVTFFQM